MTTFRCSLFVGLIIAGVWTPMSARGDLTELASDRFGYTGSYTEYSSLSNARSGTSSIGSGTIGQTDLSMFFTNNAENTPPPYAYTNSNYFLTAWFYTTTGPNQGDNNPNNQVPNFIQIANDPVLNSVPQIGTANAYWSSNLTRFTIAASGANADYTNSAARFQTPLGDSSTTFISYSLNATFSGLNMASYNSTDGAYESTGDTAGMSVNGTFTALAYNSTSGDYYDINLALNTTSYAYSNYINNTLDTAVYPYTPSFFSASVVVPEPSSLTVVGLVGLTLLGASASRRFSRVLALGALESSDQLTGRGAPWAGPTK